VHGGELALLGVIAGALVPELMGGAHDLFSGGSESRKRSTPGSPATCSASFS
jgi:hypothetical protein